jgi:hypothetical protein
MIHSRMAAMDAAEVNNYEPSGTPTSHSKPLRDRHARHRDHTLAICRSLSTLSRSHGSRTTSRAAVSNVSSSGATSTAALLPFRSSHVAVGCDGNKGASRGISPSR